MCVCNVEVLDFVLRWITGYSEFIVVFLITSRQMPELLLYGHFVLNSFEFDSYTRTRRYVTSILQASLNNPKGTVESCIVSIGT
jgi:hypothetical protein